MLPGLWNVQELATEFQLSYPTVARRIADVQPAQVAQDGTKLYVLKHVLEAITGRVNTQKVAADEKARLLKEQADKVAIENRVKRGELVPIEYMVAQDAAQYTAIRDGLLSMVDGIAVELRDIAKEGSTADVADFLGARIRAVLEDAVDMEFEGRVEETESEEDLEEAA